MGGVGRSTALAAFAIQRARLGERVAVVDLDLDAPGIGALPKWPMLIEPGHLRRALAIVSKEHVASSLAEWKWLNRLAACLSNDPATREVPWERRQVELALKKSWDTLRGEDSPAPLPENSPRDFIGYLTDVGIFRDRSDDRLDVPDLFLFGLGLKRKGGVVRR